MKGDPLVSIRCLVYNHEPFLRQCLDGFVMQKTTFPFEAIVHDDASTDGSAAIIREYAEKYPDIIKPIYETENQYSKHDGSIKRAMDAAMSPNSKYIASCEGDDYWTDPNKLQLQVDFLESHLDYFVSSHDFSVYLEDAKIYDNEGRKRFKKISYDECNGIEYHTFTLDDFFDIWFLSTLTVVTRNEPYVDENVRKLYPCYYDYIRFYYVLKKGKCAFLKNNMAVYRMHGGGVCTGRNTREWNEVFLRNNYVLYKLEKEKRVLPRMNAMFVDLFILLIKQKQYKEALFVFLRHHKNISTRNTIYCVWLIIKDLYKIAVNKIIIRKNKKSPN